MSIEGFENGVKGYVKASCVVEVNFPINLRGEPVVSCQQCQFFSRSAGICQLNKKICEFPLKYIGSNCPLCFEDTEKTADGGEILDNIPF